MKFKKEDIGLYFALGLVGAGAGLLLGALLAARLTNPGKRRYVPYIPKPEEDWDEGAEEEWDDEPIKKMDRKIARVKKSEKQSLTTEEDAVKESLLTAFIVKYQPSAIQIEMVKNGLATLDELKEVLIKEEMANQLKNYNYNTVYRETDDKPDLAELAQLPDEIEIIDKRWQLSSKQTEAKSEENLRRVFFDDEDDSFFSMSRQGHPIPMGAINELVPNEVWDVVEPYLASGIGPIFVNDLETPKHFRFEIVSEDTEDSSADNAVG